MIKDYKAPDFTKTELDVCDIITESSAIDTPDDGKGTEFVANADFFAWFGE